MARPQGAETFCLLSSVLCPLTGGVAQLGERLLCKQEVIGSIPFTSTFSEDRGQQTEDRKRPRLLPSVPWTEKAVDL